MVFPIFYEIILKICLKKKAKIKLLLRKNLEGLKIGKKPIKFDSVKIEIIIKGIADENNLSHKTR